MSVASDHPILYTSEELIAKFGVVEYVVFSIMLAVSAGIGIFFACRAYFNKTNSAKNILLGGREMGLIPITFSLIASFMSAITLLGTPAEMYAFGTQYVVIVLSYPFVMASTAELYMPVFHNLNVTTSYEYLEWRFSKALRQFASVCFIVQMILYMAIVVYAPALAISQLTGFSTNSAVIVMFVVCIFYTSLGGIKAVMWTDTFQALVMFGSFLAIIIKGNFDAGGAKNVFDKNYASNRVDLFNFDPDMTVRHTVWGLIIGGYFNWLSIYGINQTQVQRYLTVKNMRVAQKAIYWNILGVGGLLLLCAYAGMVIYAFYTNVLCDPIAAKLVERRDQLLPLFVMQVFGDIPAVPGIFVAGVFSGALSTVSSGLNSLSAVLFKDFIHGTYNCNFSENAQGWMMRGLSVVFGILSFAVVYLVKYLPGVLEAALSIFGILGGPILGAFTLGMFFPWANNMGAITGTATSLIFTLWMGIGQTVVKYKKQFIIPSLGVSVEGCPSSWNVTLPVPRVGTDDYIKLYEVSYIWYSAISCMMCVVIGIIVSLISGSADIRKINPKLISPGLRRIFDIWPSFLRNRWYRYVDKIGSEYVMSDRELNLLKHQILDDQEIHENNHFKEHTDL